MTPKAIVAGVLGALALMFGYASAFTVTEGWNAVIYRWGQAQYVTGPGLHFKVPILDTKVWVDMREQSNPETMEASTADRVPVKVKMSQTWRVTDSKVFAIQYGSKERFEDVVLDRRFREAAKDAMSKAPTAELLGNRGEVSRQIDVRMARELEGYPARIISSQIEDIDPPPAYREAVVAKEKAREDAEREKHVLEQFKTKAQQEVATKSAEADGLRAVAQAQADAIRVKGEAEAKAAEMVGKAIGNNPRLIEYEQAKRWDGKLPTMQPSEKSPVFLQVPRQ